MKLIDKREVVFRDRRTEILFPGSGQSLHNNKDVEKNQDGKTKIHSLESVKETGIIPSLFILRLSVMLVLCTRVQIMFVVLYISLQKRQCPLISSWNAFLRLLLKTAR